MMMRHYVQSLEDDSVRNFGLKTKCDRAITQQHRDLDFCESGILAEGLSIDPTMATLFTA